MIRLSALVLLLLCSLAPAHAAQTRYVTDQLVVSVRQSVADGAPIVATLRTGAAVEVIAEQGRFLQVRTEQGQQGFVASQYFTTEAPAAALLARSQKELTRLQEALAKATKERDAALAQLKNGAKGTDDVVLQKLQADLTAAESKYQALATGAKDVVATTQERDRLQQEVAQLRTELAAAPQQAGAAQTTSPLRWFLVGAGVLLVGWILGKASRQKRRF